MTESTEQQATTQTTTTTEESAFSALLKKSFKPASDERQQAIEGAVGTLCDWALRNTTLISDDTNGSVKSLISEIDKMISDQVNAIIHAEEFQSVESAWRGLHYLVNNTETDETLKIRVMPITKTELRKTLKKFKGSAWDTSPIFKKIYEEEYGLLGGEPYGCLIGDYYFDHSPADVEMLGEMAKVAAAAHAPFISAAAPSVLGMDSWQELSNPRDL
ncbi:MAG: hypothetical protein JWN04_4161, partial [Myxococcaceae bacterium]|nr:hypothetical protein [Myxococcaceae bacterium]